MGFFRKEVDYGGPTNKKNEHFVIVRGRDRSRDSLQRVKGKNATEAVNNASKQVFRNLGRTS